MRHACSVLFCYDGPATSQIYTLSLHDALPIWQGAVEFLGRDAGSRSERGGTDEEERSRRTHEDERAQNDDESEGGQPAPLDRKSTRLNSSHVEIPYAVSCLKQKKPNLRSNLNN